MIADQLGLEVDAVTDNKHLIDDLGADSLSIVELVMQLEEQYDIDIPDEDAENLDTVLKVKEYIRDYA